MPKWDTRRSFRSFVICRCRAYINYSCLALKAIRAGKTRLAKYTSGREPTFYLGLAGTGRPGRRSLREPEIRRWLGVLSTLSRLPGEWLIRWAWNWSNWRCGAAVSFVPCAFSLISRAG